MTPFYALAWYIARMTTWRLTCAIRTPAGGVFLEVVHVEMDCDEKDVADRFFGAARAFYSEIRTEPVPHYAAPLRITAA